MRLPLLCALSSCKPSPYVSAIGFDDVSFTNSLVDDALFTNSPLFQYADFAPDSALLNAPNVQALEAGVFIYVFGVLSVILTRILLQSLDFLGSRLTLEDRKLPWILPWTADSSVPLPTLDQLRGDDFVVGSHRTSRGRTYQFISVHERPDVDGVQGKSYEWSEHYNKLTSGEEVAIYIYKKIL